MLTFFETIKGFFFFLTIVIGIFFLKWYYIFSEEKLSLLWNIIMPGYLLLTWTIIGYIIGYFYIIQKEISKKEEKEKIYIKAFLAGIIIGILLSIVYIFNT